MEEILTRNEQKTIAIDCLKQLRCFKPYLDTFKQQDIVTMYEGIGGYCLSPDYGSDETELMDYIQKIEAEKGILVYAVIHNHFEFGECYTMLCVGKYKADAKKHITSYSDGTNSVFAWVWNKDAPEYYSEFGHVGITAQYGGLVRIW